MVVFMRLFSADEKCRGHTTSSKPPQQLINSAEDTIGNVVEDIAFHVDALSRGEQRHIVHPMLSLCCSSSRIKVKEAKRVRE